MAWIKQNYDRFLLAVFALVLLICAGLLINNARGYNEVFKSLSDQVPKNTKLPPVPEKDIAEKQQQLTTPAVWQPRMVNSTNNRPILLPLFRSTPIIDNNGVAVPLDGSIVLHQPIPNDWLTDHKQDLLATNVLEQDADGDGFSTLDEWNWDPKTDPKDPHTDPNDKNSHPPYYTKLYLKRFVHVPFHLRFESKNGETFFINNTDSDEIPTQTAKMGGTVTLGKFKFKLTKFEPKFDKSQGFNKDVSELTLTNIDTQQQVVLPKGEDVDSPTTYAVLNYTWMNLKEFAVQRDGEFTLAPENNVKYKVVELSDTDVKVLKVDENKELHLRTQQH